MKSKRLLLALAALSLTGCAAQGGGDSNAAPSIVGAKDIQCVVNSTIDFLDGLAALDREDGDITPDMKIAVTPTVEVVDGRATFDKVGEYDVQFKATDSAGKTTIRNVSVSVVARDIYTRLDMPYGFSGVTSGKAEFDTCGMVNGEFVVKAHGHEVAEDVQIARVFTLFSDVQYTFHYTMHSATAGKARLLADGLVCAETHVHPGENALAFDHVFHDESKPTRDVTMSLCLGGLEEVDVRIKHLETSYPQKEGSVVDRTKNYTFTGWIIPRIENGCEGDVYTEDGGKTAVLSITKAIPEIWLGGMFVNTNVSLKRGVTYTVSFDLEAKEDKDYEVFLQCNQWNEKKFEEASIYNPDDGHYSKDITVSDDEHVGPLWLYVQSGTQTNDIRMKNLKVEEHLTARGGDVFPISDYEESHAGGYFCTFSSYLGDYRYHLGSFSSVDGEQQVRSQPFRINGSGGNYVLSFRAKATAPIEVVVAAPVAGGWDPSILWSRITLSEDERVYTFFMNGAGADRDYTICWQFGAANNQKYHDVDVEVSDVAICLRNAELDG